MSSPADTVKKVAFDGLGRVLGFAHDPKAAVQRTRKDAAKLPVKVVGLGLMAAWKVKEKLDGRSGDPVPAPRPVSVPDPEPVDLPVIHEEFTTRAEAPVAPEVAVAPAPPTATAPAKAPIKKAPAKKAAAAKAPAAKKAPAKKAPAVKRVPIPPPPPVDGL